MSSYPYSPQSDDIIRWLGGGVYKHEINNPDNYTKYNKMKTLKNDVLDVVGLFMYVLDKIRRFDVQSRPFTKSSLIEHCKDFTINLDGLQIQERPSCLPTDVVLPDVKFGQIGLGGLLLEVKSLVARYEHIPPRWATRLQKWEDIFWEHDEAAVAKAAARMLTPSQIQEESDLTLKALRSTTAKTKHEDAVRVEKRKLEEGQWEEVEEAARLAARSQKSRRSNQTSEFNFYQATTS